MTFAHLGSTLTLDQLRGGLETLNLRVGQASNHPAIAALPNDDARKSVLHGIQRLLVGYAATMRAVAHGRKQAQVRHAFGGYANRPVDEVLEMAAHAWKLGIVTLPHFKLDHLFQCLLSELGKSPGRTGFGANAKKLLGIVGLPSAARAEAKLELLTALRNSLHNDGVHKGADISSKHMGVSFDLRRGQKHKSLTVGHILTALHLCVEVVEEIHASHTVRGLAEVEDLAI